MIAAAASFGAGFVFGQAWALLAFGHALNVAETFTWRFIILVVVETLVAAGAFVLTARAGRLKESWSACLVAICAGWVTNAFTVGSHAQVPRFFQGDAQLVVYVFSVGILSAIMGWGLAKLFRTRTEPG